MIPEWNSFINADCMNYLKQFPDNYFDLAIVDPPYGDAGGNRGSIFERYKNVGGITPTDAERNYQLTRTGGTWAEKYGKKIISWDIAPEREYFEQLFRVSRNQIIWGGNYFDLPPTRCFIVWEKLSITENFSMAMAEYAWTSFSSNAKIFKHAPQGTTNDSRFHPTQKPIALYEWILSRYAKDGETILDTHAGSASSLIACRRSGHRYIAFEIDPVYYEKAKARLDAEVKQVNIFDFFDLLQY